MRQRRATRAQLNTAAGSNQLLQGEFYLITDEDKIAIGTGVGTYIDIPAAGSTTPYLPTIGTKPADGLFIGNLLSGNLTTSGGALNRIDIAPFSTGIELLVSEAHVSISYPESSSTATVIIYNTDSNGRPTTVAAQSEYIDTSTAGTYGAVLDFTFQANTLYYVGVWTSASIVLRLGQSYSSTPITWTNAATPIRQHILRTTSAYGSTAPNWTYASSQHISADVPLVLFKTGEFTLGAPTATAATSIETTSFQANWNAVIGALSYRLDVSTNGIFSSFVTGYEDKTVSGTSSSVTGLISGNTYYYRLRAVRNALTSANSNFITVTTTSIPDPPTGLYLNNGGSGYLDGGWDAVSGATKYEYRLNINSGGYGSAIDNGTSRTVWLGPYLEDTLVCIQVRVTTSNGTSNWSTQVCQIVGEPI